MQGMQLVRFPTVCGSDDPNEVDFLVQLVVTDDLRLTASSLSGPIAKCFN